MRTLTLISLLLTASACGKGQPVDCTKLNMQSVDRCFEKNRTKGEVATLITCLPFSDRLTTDGVWIVGFEKNDFFEGPLTVSPDVMWNQSTGASLVVDDKLHQKIAPAGPQFYAIQVDVVGRRALCPVGALNPYPIAVESLKIVRHLGSR